MNKKRLVGGRSQTGYIFYNI